MADTTPRAKQPLDAPEPISEPTPVEPAPATPKALAKGTEVNGAVTILTRSFNVERPSLVGQAEAMFKEQVNATLAKLTLVGIDQIVGRSATYRFVGVVE